MSVCYTGFAGQQCVGAKIARLMRLGMGQMWTMSNSNIYSASPVKFTPPLLSQWCRQTVMTDINPAGFESTMSFLVWYLSCKISISYLFDRNKLYKNHQQREDSQPWLKCICGYVLMWMCIFVFLYLCIFVYLYICVFVYLSTSLHCCHLPIPYYHSSSTCIVYMHLSDQESGILNPKKSFGRMVFHLKAIFILCRSSKYIFAFLVWIFAQCNSGVGTIGTQARCWLCGSIHQE